MTNRQQILDDTTTSRARAQELLKALEAAKAAADAPSPPTRDLYKRVTGQSSLENSIAATRRALDAYDRLIAELECAEAPVVNTTVNTTPQQAKARQ